MTTSSPRLHGATLRCSRPGSFISDATDLRAVLDGQLGIAWQLLRLHMADLGDAECLWRPTPRGLHVIHRAGTWVAEWPETETYLGGPPSIAWLTDLHDEWVAEVAALPDSALASTDRTRWPFTDRPFADLVAWLNVELMKNASEIGYARFLYAARG